MKIFNASTAASYDERAASVFLFFDSFLTSSQHFIKNLNFFTVGRESGGVVLFARNALDKR